MIYDNAPDMRTKAKPTKPTTESRAVVQKTDATASQVASNKQKRPRKLKLGVVRRLLRLNLDDEFEAPAQLMIAELAWPEDWLTEERRLALRAIMEDANDYLMSEGGAAAMSIVQGGAIVAFITPGGGTMYCDAQLAKWAKEQGCSSASVELTYL